MKRQPYPVAQLTGGLDVSVDAIFLVDKASPYLRNVRFDKGLIKKGVGFAGFGTGLPLDGTVMLIDSFPLEGGTVHTLIVTTKWVYRYISTSNSYEKKNPLASFTGDEDNQFSSVVTGKAVAGSWQDLFILTNGKDKIQKWVGTDADFADLGGWTTAPTLAKSLAVFRSRLIGGFTVDAGTICPRRVQWSIAGDPEDITGTGSGFVDLVETSDWVVTLALLKNKLYIFKERSIWELPYVGGTDVFGTPVLKIEGVGTFSPGSIVNLGEELLFYGTDNIYLYDGLDLVSIGKNIYSYLYETEKRVVNAAKANRVPSAYIEELKSYQICLPSKASEVPDLLAEYNFDAQSWTLRDKEITAFGFYTVPSVLTWADLVGPWKATTGAVALTFDASAKTIKRGDTGSFITDGFTAKCKVKTTADLNPGPFTVATDGVAASVLTLDDTPVNEGPVTKIATSEQDWAWMEKALPTGAPTTLIGDSGGYVYEDDRITKSADYMCFETKDWMFQHNQRLTEFHIQAKGGPFNCYYSLDQGLTWSPVKTFAVSTDWTEYVWWLNFTCQHIRLRIESYAEDFEIKWIEPWYIPRVRSKSLSTS